MAFSRYLIQYIFAEIGHVAVIRHWTIIIILEMLLQSNWIMWDVQHCVQIVREHLRKKYRA